MLAAWTHTKFKGKSKSQAIENHQVLEGRRAVEFVGKGVQKRPLSLVVSKSSQENRKIKRARKENFEASNLQVNVSPRRLRSRAIATSIKVIDI